jgi:hypothetical protein
MICRARSIEPAIAALGLVVLSSSKPALSRS